MSDINIQYLPFQEKSYLVIKSDKSNFDISIVI